MKVLTNAMAAAGLVAASLMSINAAHAERAYLGWTVGTPCSKVENWTLKFAEQRFYTYVDYNLSQSVNPGTVAACAATGTPQAFLACMGGVILGSSIGIEGRCMW